MNNPGLPLPLWQILDGRLWHATGAAGLVGIIASGTVRVLRDRYNGSFAKLPDAVSLFDFGPTARDDWQQFDNWSGWLDPTENRLLPHSWMRALLTQPGAQTCVAQSYPASRPATSAQYLSKA
jgi:hypothetical protein